MFKVNVGDGDPTRGFDDVRQRRVIVSAASPRERVRAITTRLRRSDSPAGSSPPPPPREGSRPQYAVAAVGQPGGIVSTAAPARGFARSRRGWGDRNSPVE